jgi:hypothetical protein
MVQPATELAVADAHFYLHRLRVLASIFANAGSDRVSLGLVR